MRTKSRNTRIILLSALIGIFLFSALSLDLLADAAYPTIPVGNQPMGLAFAPSNGAIYVANDNSFGTVSMISTLTNTVVATITVGAFPVAVAYASNGDIYVANQGKDSNSVSVINTSTNTVVGTITVGANPGVLAYASNGDIYVGNGGSGTVSVIDTSTNTVVGPPITVSPPNSYPDGIAFAPSNGDIYVANWGSNIVSVISTLTNTVVGAITVGHSPDGLAYASSNGYIYVANIDPGTVSVIDTSTNTVVGAPIKVGNEPAGVAYASNGNIYVTNSEGSSNSVSVINTLTNTVVGAPITVGIFPDGIAFASSNGDIYVANSASNTISVIPTLAVSVSPDSAMLDVGQSQLFTASASGGSGTYSPSTGYQWYVGGVAQSGQSASTFSFTTGSAGSYLITVTVTDSLGATSPQSPASSLGVNPALVAPTVSALPSTIDLGQTSSLTSTAISSGTSPYTYQWYSQAPGGSFSPISGATSSSYSFVTSGAMAMGTWNFKLQVTDTASVPVAAMSIGASVMVNSAPTVSISSPNGPVTLDVGQSQTFSATPSGGSGSYTSFQWYLSGFAVSGAISQSWTYSTSQASASTLVTVTVTDSLGSTSPQSSAAAITVAASPTVSIAPVGPLTIDAGQVQAFTATASGGVGTLSYQWYLDSVAIGSNSASYSYTATAGSHSITCKVTDSASVPITSPASNAVSLTVNPALTPTPTPTPTQAPTPTPTITPTSPPTIPEMTSVFAIVALVVATCLIIIGIRKKTPSVKPNLV